MKQFTQKSGALLLALAVSVAGCTETDGTDGEPAATGNWDGNPVNETDQVVTLIVPKEPTEILLNGETATVLFSAALGTAKVLIPSDENGISCTNSYIAKFTDDEPGQLIANHCHDEPIFAVNPGDILDMSLTKEDVDNPDDDRFIDMGDPAASLEFEWSANGFEQLPADFEWSGSGGDLPGMTLAVPETDDFVWIADCENGQTANYIALDPGGLQHGQTASLQLEVNGQQMREYTALIGTLPYGDGGADSVSPIIDLPIDDPIFTEMKSGEWLYMVLQSGDDAVKLRTSLRGADKALDSFLGACQ